MCFSAGASFGAAAILSIIGTASIKKARSTSQIFFASIPFIFSIQQLFEGFLWLSLSGTDVFPYSGEISTYAFLVFAQIVWPTWVPLSILLLEKKEDRKIIQKIALAAGILVSSFLGFCLISFPVTAKVMNFHIAYILDYPDFPRIFSAVLYIFATVGSPLLSGIKHMKWLGAATLLSFLVTVIFFPNNIISVWCFFAALISVVVLAVMVKRNQLIEFKKPQTGI